MNEWTQVIQEVLKRTDKLKFQNADYILLNAIDVYFETDDYNTAQK